MCDLFQCKTLNPIVVLMVLSAWTVACSKQAPPQLPEMSHEEITHEEIIHEEALQPTLAPQELQTQADPQPMEVQPHTEMQGRFGVGATQMRVTGLIEAMNAPLEEVLQQLQQEPGLQYRLEADGSRPVNLWLSDPSLGELIEALHFSTGCAIEMMVGATGAMLIIKEGREDSSSDASRSRYAVGLHEAPALGNVIEGPVQAENFPLGNLMQIVHSESGAQLVLGDNLADQIVTFSKQNPTALEILEDVIAAFELQAYAINHGERYVIYIKRNL